ncbi:MAG: hypothetical protein MUO26_05390 [Methanotrichaceae archaeon]|nr:hypothetical protein [Methanotrichaceae archaeon]
MSIKSLERRASSISLSLERVRLQKQADELEDWRGQNADRLRWDLFLLLQDPALMHPNNLKVDKEDFEKQNRFAESNLAYYAMINRVMKHGFNKDGYLNRLNMSTEELAFAECLETHYQSIDDEDLLSNGIFQLSLQFGLGLAWFEKKMSYAKATQIIDEHRGSPEWRQICGTSKEQRELDNKLEISSITEIPAPGLPWHKPDKVKVEQLRALYS